MEVSKKVLEEFVNYYSYHELSPDQILYHEWKSHRSSMSHYSFLDFPANRGPRDTITPLIQAYPTKINPQMEER